MRANAVPPTAVLTTPVQTTAVQTTAVQTTAVQLSVLICDDRPAVRRVLSQVLQLRSPGAVESVGAGCDLLSICEMRSPAQIMIGVHPGSTFGVDALDLLLGQHPSASPVVYGSRRDVEFLAEVYARGAAGLLLWELGDH